MGTSIRIKIYSMIKTTLPSILTVLIPMLFLSCDKTENDNYIAPCGKIINCHACGVDDVGNNLKWLNDLIVTSQNDKTGNYLGRIWYKKYNDQDIIVTDMSLGSGGIAYYCYKCSGENIVIEDLNFYNSLSQSDILWTNICID
ncbi:MAG TPA: hypothetical protein DDW27_11520 [Bacteroidales bacterium]|nr:hypothetical protein [Bacteroidales bacterium]